MGMVRGMKGFWLILAVGLALTGCTGQTIEGRWRGPLPYRGAEDCRVKLFSNGNFEIACQKDVWVGQGRYEFSHDKLTLTYAWLSHNKEIVKEPTPLVYDVEPEGNKIGLKADYQNFTWQRTTTD